MRKILYINIREYYGDIVLAPKVDSLNIVSNTKSLSVVSKPENNSNIEVFENKNTKVNIDGVSFLNANSNAEPEEKVDNKRKWLIGAGIALGSLAIGITTTIFLKKLHKFNLKTLSPLEEFDNYMQGIARDGKAFKPVIDNPNSAFSRYYTSTQKGIIKINPTLEGFQQFIYKNADNLNVSADDYYSIVKKCAKEAKIKASLDKSLNFVRREFIENSDKIYEWNQIFLTNSKNSQGVVFHKFYNKKIYNQAIKEYKNFVEQITGKKVLIGCPSRMSWGIEALGVFNNPNAYKDFDCILIGHGKGSSLITDITSPNTWRFSDNNKSVWEFIEKHAKNKKIMTLVCETNGIKLANKIPEEIIDNSGISMVGIGNEVLPDLNASSNPIKICKGGIRHIIGHIENSGKTIDVPANLNTKFLEHPKIVLYDLDLNKYMT